MKILIRFNDYVFLNFHHDAKKRFSTVRIQFVRCGFKDNEICGVAKCRKKEPFKTSVGRFVALTKCLADPIFTRQDRLEIWAELDRRGVNLEPPPKI